MDNSLPQIQLPSKRKPKIFWVVILIVVILVILAGGTVYWLIVKSNKIATSAMTAANGSPSPTTIVQGKTPSPKVNLTTLSMPSSDAEGQELTDIPRYPGSMRSVYYQSPDSGAITIEYLAKASSKTIIDYYRDQLAKTGWVVSSKEDKAIDLSSEEAELSVQIVEEDVNNNITKYDLYYLKKPEEESPSPTQ